MTDTDGGRGHTRRRLLGCAAAGVAATTGPAGCGLFDDDPRPAPPPDPLTPILGEALDLAAAYDRVIAAQPGLAPRLSPLAEAHRAHAAELSRFIGPGASVPPSAAPVGRPGAATTLTDLRRAEQGAQRTAGALCRQAPAGRAALVGSIAAARASHAEALR